MGVRLTNILATVLDWAKAKADLAVLKPREMELRLQVVEAVFGKPGRGTTRHELGQGRTLKVEVSPQAKIDQKALPGCIEKLKATGPVGELKADRLFSFKAELRMGEWKQLTDEERELFAGAVTIDDATPSLELLEA